MQSVAPSASASPKSSGILLQLALDETDLGRARLVASATSSSVDVIEVGTVLLAAEGVNAIRALRDDHPDHLIVGDIRIMRAGKALAELCFEAGADWVSVMAEAPDDTIAAVVAVARKHGGEVQVELDDAWDGDDLHRWRDLGVTQVIMHRTHEAEDVGLAWGAADTEAIVQAARAGMLVSVTGGITIDELAVFDAIPVGVVIAGRSIRCSDDPSAAAAEFRMALNAVGPTETGGS